MNRIIAPDIQAIDHVSLPKVESITLDNGVPVYGINAGEQDVVKVELIFKAGKWYEEKNLVADYTNRMLREGTTRHTARQLADTFDYYGANIHYGAGFETGGATLYSLTKQTEHLLPLLFEVFTESTFPENELATILSNRKQRLLVDLKKNEFVANRQFVQALFGTVHPYGRVTEFADFDQLTLPDLKAFYEHQYNAINLTILVSGKFDDALLKQLNLLFGSAAFKGPAADVTLSHAVSPAAELVHHIEKADSVQTAIILGNHAINKHHPDFLKLSVLNTVFGGYFGSRLMSNIREEKGYTYGIHSSFVSYPHAGFMEISSEVGKDVKEATLTEIEKEIQLLRTELIEEEELQVVKNYMSGRILRSVDGPIKYSETFKGLLLYNQTPDYIHQLLRTIREVTAEELLQLAQQYLDYDKMYKVTVG